MAPNAMTEALNSFFGTPAKTAKPTPPPEPIVVVKTSPPKPQPFSFFQAAAPKPAPQAVSKPSPVPARKSPTLTLKAVVVEKKSPVKPAPFSFFKQASPPEPAPAVPTPSPVPARKPSPTLSLFKAKETPPPKPPVVAEAKKSVQGSGTFSLFGGGPKAVAPAPKAAPVAVEEKKVAQRSGTFSLFSAPGTRTIAKAPAVEKKAVAAKQTIAIAPPKKAAPVVPDNIPVIGKFKQNADGSITGIVRNSKTFRTGTEITTSPVPRGAKAGTVVKTSSGSKYRLE